MDALREVGRYLFEAKIAGTLNQNKVIVQCIEHSALQQGLGRGIAFRGDAREGGLVGHKGLADADEAVHAARCHHLADLLIEFGWRDARLLNVREDERGMGVLSGLAAVQEVEGNVQRIDVGVVEIVDEGRMAHAVLHLQAHGHGLQLL